MRVRVSKQTKAGTSRGVVVEWSETTLTVTADGKPPKLTAFDPSELDHQAQRELTRLMKAGHVRLAERAPIAAGDVVFEAHLALTAHVFDLHPSAREIVVAQGAGRSDAYSLEHFDLVNGTRRTLLEGSEPHAVVHAVRYDASGSAVWFQVNQTVSRLALSDGSVEPISRHPSIGDALKPGRFNEYATHLRSDRYRERWLVFEGSELIVRTSTGGVLHRRDFATDAARLARAWLAPSGRTLMLELEHDGTSEHEIWDLDAARCTSRLRDRRFRAVGVLAADQQLLASSSDAGLEGPTWIDRTGKRADDNLRPQLLPYTTVYDLAVNAAEDRVAFALKWGAVVLRWPDRHKLLDVRYPQVHAVQISDDDCLLGIAGHDGRIAVVRMP